MRPYDLSKGSAYAPIPPQNPGEGKGYDKEHRFGDGMRFAVYLIGILSLFLLLAGIPSEYRSQLGATRGLYLDALAAIRLSPETYAGYRTGMDVLLSGAFILLGMVIIWRKSDDRMVMLVSLASLTFGALYVPTQFLLASDHPLFWIPVALLRCLGLALGLIFFYIFPDGRFVPPKSRWLAAAWLLMVLVWLIFPQAPFNLISVYPWIRNLAASFLLYIGFFATGAASQVYRYYRVSTPLQRQQTKWVVYGTSLAVAGSILYHVPLLIFPVLNRPGVPMIVYTLTLMPLNYLLTLLAPVAMGISVLRYHLWDLDVIVNRSLVYGALTVLLGILYFSGVGLIEMLVAALTSQALNPDASRLAVLGSSLVTVGLFTPMRRTLQTVIDRSFYREKYDAEKTLLAFGESLNHEVDPDHLSQRLLQVVDETMQPDLVSLWVKPRPDR